MEHRMTIPSTQRLMHATPAEVICLDRWLNECYAMISDAMDAMCDATHTTILDVHGLRRAAIGLSVEAANVNALASSIMKIGHDAPPF